VLFAVVGCLAIAGVAGCGSSSSSSSGAAVSGTSTPAATTHFAKTKFVLHIGLAGWAFHRYIYKPFRAGEFSRPFSHKIVLAKAALAALFTYHELKLAATDVRSSKVLQVLFSPITLLAAKFASLRNEFLHGRYSAADISSAQAAGGSISAAAAAKGYPNGDIPGHI
jgi:hypothetical protein